LSKRTKCHYCGGSYVVSENIHQCKDGGESMRRAFELERKELEMNGFIDMLMEILRRARVE
jgi:hypothetical protein